MTDLVQGEASESDEEPFTKANITKTSVAVAFAREVPGEATESDEDVYEKHTTSGSSNYNNTKETANPEVLYRNKLLQRKLIENNIAIYKSYTNFIKNFVTSASKQLLSTDQLLIKSQVSMQSVLSSLKQTQSSVKQLHEKSSDIFTTNFLPNIRIPEQTTS